MQRIPHLLAAYAELEEKEATAVNKLRDMLTSDAGVGAAQFLVDGLQMMVEMKRQILRQLAAIITELQRPR